jgi:negative regulator of sigma E activity
MSDKIGEQLSAFMDGETHKNEHELLVRRLELEPDLKARWARYHVIRDVLQRQYHPELAPGFADRVMAALEDEPGAVRHARRSRIRAGGALSGLALAAAVAGVAIFGARYLATSDVDDAVIAQNDEPSAMGPAALNPPPGAEARAEVSGPDLLLVVDHKLILRDPGLNRYPWVGVNTSFTSND